MDHTRRFQKINRREVGLLEWWSGRWLHLAIHSLLALFLLIMLHLTVYLSVCPSTFVWLTKSWVTYKLIDWLTDWLTAWLTVPNLVAEGRTDQLTDSLTRWLIDPLTHHRDFPEFERCFLTVWLVTSIISGMRLFNFLFRWVAPRKTL